MKHRIPAFMTVGAIGFVIQLGALALLTLAVGWPYGPATALAVQLAVVQNFLGHERWTWRDRTSAEKSAHRGRQRIGRFLRYEVTTGLTSIAGNVLCTALFVERAGMPVFAANVAAVAVMSIANFLLSDRWVFARAVGVATAVAVLSLPAAAAAEVRPETGAAWDRYVRSTEARLGQGQAGAETATDGQVTGQVISVPGGTIHHWRGSTVIRGTTVDAVVRALMNPGTPPPQEDVIESRVMSRSNDSLRVYLKLVRRTIMTVMYDTEHLVTFRRLGPGLATSRSVSTRIAEVDGGDRGFLWRLNAYWRYVQIGNDVQVKLESLSLSRDVPTLLKPVAGPLISRIARESVTKALDAVRSLFERN